MMRTFLNLCRIRLLPIYLLLATVGVSVTLISCSKDYELEVQNDFPFEVNIMPIPKDISNAETVEIRLQIQRSGNYSNTEYYIRYFQFDGKGVLQYYNEQPYLPNESYLLPNEEFRLYYTSNSTVTQSFEVWISDNFGNEKKISFQFNSSD